MPAKFVIKSTALSSNKTQGKLEIGKDELAYWNFIGSETAGVGNAVYVLRPKLDKLSLVFNVERESHRKTIKGLLLSAVKDEQVPWYQEAKSAGQAKKYNVEALLTPPDGKHPILIQVDPKKKKEPKPAFMRFEFNPYKLGKKGLAFFKENLSEFLLDQIKYDDLKKDGKLTRLDIACDLVNVQLGDLVFRSLKPGKSHVYYGLNRHGGIGEKALSAEVVALVVKQRANAAGMGADRYAGHSLRAGLATSAAAAGVPSWKIKDQTGHASDTMLSRYIRDGELFVGNAAAAIL
jgi:hypothetical protein